MSQDRKPLIRNSLEIRYRSKKIQNSQVYEQVHKNELIVYSNALLFFKHTAI